MRTTREDARADEGSGLNAPEILPTLPLRKMGGTTRIRAFLGDQGAVPPVVGVIPIVSLAAVVTTFAFAYTDALEEAPAAGGVQLQLHGRRRW